MVSFLPGTPRAEIDAGVARWQERQGIGLADNRINSTTFGDIIGGAGDILGLVSGVRGLTASAPRISSFGGPGFGIAPPGIGTPAFGFDSPAFLRAAPGSARAQIPGMVAGSGRLGEVGARFRSLGEGASRFAPTLEELRGDIGGLRNRADALQISEAESFGGLASAVAPGFGKLSKSIRDTYRDRAEEAVGNLRESLSRRGVLGSSFGSDAEARVRLAFAEEEGKALNQANVAEIGLSLDVEKARGDAARSLMEVDSRLVAQQAGLVAAQLGLDEFASRQLTNELATIRQKHDQTLDLIKTELAELNIAGNIANGLTSIAQRNAAFDLQSAILNAEAQGKVLSGLTSTGLGLNAAGQLVSTPSVIGRVGGLADRIFGGGAAGGFNPALPLSATNLPPAIEDVGGISVGGGFGGFNPTLPIGPGNLPPLDELSGLLTSGEEIAGGFGSDTLAGGIGGDTLSGAGDFLGGLGDKFGNFLGSDLSLGLFPGAGLAIPAFAFGLAKIMGKGKNDAQAKIPTNSVEQYMQFPSFRQADVSGLTQRDFFFMEAANDTDPNDPAWVTGWRLDPVTARALGLPSAFIPPETMMQYREEAKRRGLDRVFAEKRQFQWNQGFGPNGGPDPGGGGGGGGL